MYLQNINYLCFFFNAYSKTQKGRHRNHRQNPLCSQPYFQLDSLVYRHPCYLAPSHLICPVVNRLSNHHHYPL